MSNGITSQNGVVSISDDPAAGGSSYSPAPTPEVVDGEAGKKRRAGDFPRACLHLAHGACAPFAGRHDQIRRLLLFVYRSACLGTMGTLILMRIRFRAVLIEGRFV